MKRKVLAVLLAMLLFVAGFVVGRVDWSMIGQTAYLHKDYVSAITKNECFLCGDQPGSIGPGNWKPNNIGILDLNTFEIHYVEINRYEDGGKLATTASGVFSMGGMTTTSGNVKSALDSDNGYSHITITGVQYEVDREVVESHLCQDCLDEMNTKIRYSGAPAEFAVVNYQERTIRPLVPQTISFGLGDFLIDCQFKDHGEIRLLAAYLPFRYETEEGT